MERRHNAPSWRASLGGVVTVVSAVLLTIAAFQAYWLGNEANGTPAMLYRERIALQFEHRVYPLVVSLARYQNAIESLGPPQATDALRASIDARIRDADAFIRTDAGDLDVLPDWNQVRTQWQTVRSLRHPYTGRAIDEMTSTLLNNVIYNVENTSGLAYETNKWAQDLADISFSKVPAAASVALRLDMLSENAMRRHAIAIPDRIRLARHVISLRADGANMDFALDDWPLLISRAPELYLGTAGQTARISADYRRFVAAGTALSKYSNANVVMRDRPTGDPQQSRRLALAAIAATNAINADVDGMLDRLMAARLQYSRLRNVYLYAVILLSAAFIVGIMLLVAEITTRRERELLEKATRESERLSAELARQNAERALRLSEAQFRAVFDGAAVGIAVLDRNGSVLDANAVFRSVYGENASGVFEGHESEFGELMLGERDLFEFEQHVMTPRGLEAWTDSTVSLVNDETGKPYFAIWMFRDLTELKRNQRRMQHDQTHDALTGLPNRTQFESKIREQFAEAKTRPQSLFAVLFVDLDRFKDINDSLGHESGDFAIALVAQRLRGAIEPADVVARMGGDEFAVLVRSLPDVLHVEVIARRVLGALAKPVSLGNRSIFISASVGIALANTGYLRAEDIMRDADIAMRYAKTGGGARFSIFDSKMHARAEKRLQLTTDLRLGIERGEFDLLYQPIVRIEDGELTGCEALLRWNHPVEGTMMPMDFMPLAEQTALAVPIGRHVLRTACRQLSRWRGRSGKRSLFPMNVNVSAAELLDPEFEATLNAAVVEFGVSPADLTLEITESVILDSGTRPNALVERLRAAGFNICIDDFGTGYSSLRYLQQFKVDAIKIDRSFVCGQDGDVASEPIVRTLMTLAEAFDVRVVAEGIETSRQRDVLRNAGCRFGQGFYYAQALSAAELESMFPAAFETARRSASA